MIQIVFIILLALGGVYCLFDAFNSAKANGTSKISMMLVSVCFLCLSCILLFHQLNPI